MSLVTTCPSCGTVFRIVREQLDASSGWVRCGHCMDVFDAKSQFSDLELAATVSSDGLASAMMNDGNLSFVVQATSLLVVSLNARRTGVFLIAAFYATADSNH
jgi:predicted Zn finger-like uncharacterized protein